MSLRQAGWLKFVLLGLFLFVTADFCLIRWSWFRDFVSITDEAIYVQLAHNTLHGKFLLSTLAPEATTSAGLPLFGIHVIPSFLFALVPYALHPHPLTLCFLQIVLLASGVFPAFLLAKQNTGNDFLALAVA